MDFEDAYNFTTVLLPWENNDVDGGVGITFTLTLNDNISYPLVYPGYLEPQSFLVFNPEAVTSVPNLVNYIRPKSGDRIAISVRPVSGNSNDWFISPKLSLLDGSSKVSFFARGLVAAFQEKFNVLVSTTDTEPGSFTSISGSVPVTLASASWTEFEYSLNDFNGQDVYVAIQCVTGDGGAMFMIDDIEITTSDVSIEKNKYSGISVVPNPTTGKLFITSAEKIKNIEIFDATGKPVLNERINSFDKSIDISLLQTGIYFIRIHTGNGTEVMKVVKN